MRKYLYNIVFITTVSFISSVAYTKSDIQQCDILAFDPSVACRILAIQLKQMEQTLAEKEDIIKDSEKSLRSAATSSSKYGNILMEYHRTLDQFKSMKKDYDQLILERENNCMPNSNEKSKN